MATEKILTPADFYKKLRGEDKAMVLNLQDRKAIDFIPTGSWILNFLIGDGTMTGKPGGFPRGHISEVFGDESCGKSTLALSAIREAQKLGGLGVLMDFEKTFHPDYAERIGIDTDPNKLIVLQPNYFEAGARMIRDTLLMKPYIIVSDSVSAMTPKLILEGTADDTVAIGLQARLMSYFLSYISKFLKDANTSLLFTNQLRSVIKKSKFQAGPDEESSGGHALKFYASVRLLLKKSSVEKVAVKSRLTGKEGKEPVNITIKASVVKNKIDKPYRSAPLYIRFGEGIDNILSVIKLAVNTGIIKKSGAFFTFTQGNEVLVKIQGEDKLREHLGNNEKIFFKIQNSLVIKEDEKVKETYDGQPDELPPLEELQSSEEMEKMFDQVSTTYVENHKQKKEKKEEED
jgi:recombination protein RecA